MMFRWRTNLMYAICGLLILVTLPMFAFLGGRSLGADLFTTNLLHGLSAPWLTAIMKPISTYAYHSIHWWIAGAVAAYFLVRRRSLWEGISLFAVRWGADLAQDTIKNIYARPRPVLDWVKPSSSFSYPSGTVTVGAALCIALGYLVANEFTNPVARRISVASGWVLAGLIAISRIYLGAHWLSDTIGALALAGAIVAIGFLPLCLRSRVQMPSRSRIGQEAAAMVAAASMEPGAPSRS